MRYFIELSYKGTNYHGWQIQPDASSVQEEITKALATILQEKILLVGAGRTDAGVHASQMFAHVDTVKKLTDDYVHKLNAILPNDIVIDFTLKMIQTGLPITNVDDYVSPCSEKDLHNQISEMMKIT